MESLIDVLDEVDFGVFIMSPDDITSMRDREKQSVRDNVVFELGLFIGRLGRERTFMLAPRGMEENSLPTDLLGVTPASSDPDRQDGNLVAAVGLGCNRIRRAIEAQGALVRIEPKSGPTEMEEHPVGLAEGREDCLAVIESWMGHRTSAENTAAMRFSDVDRELGLKPGAAKEYLVEAAARYNYKPSRLGEEFVTFRSEPRVRRTSYF